tara:strand:+ start:652 stop:1077 length:426 start_codon:yes stop_codon:yes gene_type:complete
LKYYLIDSILAKQGMGRIGKKIANGLRMGAKIGAGVIGTAGVVVGGLYALGAKHEQNQAQTQTNVMSGSTSIKDLSTSEIAKLYQTKPTAAQTALQGQAAIQASNNAGITPAQAKELAFQQSLAGMSPAQQEKALLAHGSG